MGSVLLHPSSFLYRPLNSSALSLLSVPQKYVTYLTKISHVSALRVSQSSLEISVTLSWPLSVRDCASCLGSVQQHYGPVSPTDGFWSGNADAAGCSMHYEPACRDTVLDQHRDNACLTVGILVLSDINCLIRTLLHGSFCQGAISEVPWLEVGLFPPHAVPGPAWAHFCVPSKGLCQAQSV